MIGGRDSDDPVRPGKQDDGGDGPRGKGTETETRTKSTVEESLHGTNRTGVLAGVGGSFQPREGRETVTGKTVIVLKPTSLREREGGKEGGGWRERKSDKEVNLTLVTSTE